MKVDGMRGTGKRKEATSNVGVSKAATPDYSALKRYFPIAEALARLFRPHVEVVLHDIRSGTVAYIANPISQRRVGEPSGEQPFEPSLDDVIGPYRKIDPCGKSFRSITSTIKDDEDNVIAFLCINYDVSLLQGIADQLSAFNFLPGSLQPHAPFFHDNWRQSLERTIEECEAAAGIPIAAMGTRDRVILLTKLDGEGVFDVRNAPKIVADRIGLSRAALYKHLKRIRAEATESAGADASARPTRRK